MQLAFGIADGNIVPELGFVGGTDVRGYYRPDGGGKTQVHPTDGGFSKTVTLAIFGTSQVCNVLPTSYSATHSRGGDGKAVDELNIYSGGVYVASDPVGGAAFPPIATTGLGNLCTFLASSIIDQSWSVTRVVVIAFGVGGSTFSNWADTTGLGKRIAIANRRATAVGLTISAWIPHIGENDNLTVDCATPLAAVIANIRAVSAAPIFIPKASWLAGVTNATVTAAQTGAVNHGNAVWAGPDLDTLDNTKRQDTTHFNDAGRTSALPLWITKLGLFGAPFA